MWIELLLFNRTNSYYPRTTGRIYQCSIIRYHKQPLYDCQFLWTAVSTFSRSYHFMIIFFLYNDSVNCMTFFHFARHPKDFYPPLLFPPKEEKNSIYSQFSWKFFREQAKTTAKNSFSVGLGIQNYLLRGLIFKL